MKKSYLSLSLIFLCLAIFYACTKENEPNSMNSETTTKIITWLESQKPPILASQTGRVETLDNNLEKAKRIETLKNSLDFLNTRTERLNDHKQFLVIPIKEDFKSIFKLESDLQPYLLLTIDKTESIIQGNVVLYAPESKVTDFQLAPNTFVSIYNSQKLENNGQFKFYNITGNFLYNLVYTDGNIQSSARITSETSTTVPAGKTASTQACYAYYMNTTVYSRDGIIIDQYQEYLGTYCEGETQDCSNPYQLCYTEGGGGGASSSECCIMDPNFEFSSSPMSTLVEKTCGLESTDPISGLPIRNCSYKWFFSTNTLLFYTWKYKSFESADMEKVNGLWKFKTVTHSGLGQDGSTPPCVTSNCKITQTQTSISSDRESARVDLNYEITVNVTCLQGTPPIPKLQYASIDLDAN